MAYKKMLTKAKLRKYAAYSNVRSEGCRRLIIQLTRSNSGLEKSDELELLMTVNEPPVPQ